MNTDLSNVYKIDNRGGEIRGCIDLVESPDDGGWYAQQYDFKRKDSATRTSHMIYPDRSSLRVALDTGKHRWGKWE